MMKIPPQIIRLPRYLHSRPGIVSGREHGHLDVAGQFLKTGLVEGELAVRVNGSFMEISCDSRVSLFRIQQLDGAGKSRIAHASRIDAALEFLQLDREAERQLLVSECHGHKTLRCEHGLQSELTVAAAQPELTRFSVDGQVDQRRGFVGAGRLQPGSNGVNVISRRACGRCLTTEISN